jgi:hypothetical protein
MHETSKLGHFRVFLKPEGLVPYQILTKKGTGPVPDPQHCPVEEDASVE